MSNEMNETSSLHAKELLSRTINSLRYAEVV